MAFWNKKKEISVTKQVVVPNLPIIEALGKIGTSYIEIKTREQLAKVFSTVSEVYSPIMYSASAFSNMKLRLFSTDKSGETLKEIFSHDILQKLSAPNPLNNWKDFLTNYYVNKKVFGNAYIFKYVPTGFNIKDANLWVLPSQYVYPVPVNRNINSYYIAENKEDFIRGYSLFTRAEPRQMVNWKPEEIMHQREPNLYLSEEKTNLYVELLEGRSPLSTLSEPISNIQKAYEAQNVILNKRGALGILTPKNNKDAVGAVTMTNDQKTALQEQFQMYGLGEEQWQYIISNVELTWQPMSLPIRELMLFEGIQNSMIAICNTLNFPILLLNYLQGATFSNVKELKKSLYQDNIIPEANAFVSELSSFLGLPEKNLILKPDFSHVPVLQADAKIEAEKDKITVDTILQVQSAIINGTLTFAGGSSILSNILDFSDEMIGGMLSAPIIQDETTNVGGIPQEQLEAQANLRGTVGGVQGILAIQASVSQGITDFDAALATMVEIYGFTEDTARRILGTPNTQNTQQNENTNTGIPDEKGTI